MNNLRMILEEAVGTQLVKSVQDIHPDVSLFELGLNSIGFITMIIAIEKHYGISIDQDELDLDRFNSINAIQRCIDEKLSGVKG